MIEVELLARAYHAEHGILVYTGSWQDEAGKWHRYTHRYCLEGDRRVVAPWAVEYTRLAGIPVEEGDG